MTRAGRKQSLLMLQVATDGQTDTGAPTRTWADVIPCYAELKDGTGSQSFAAAEVQSGQDVVAVIRWRPDITRDRHRFTFTNLFVSPPVVTVYDIVGIQNVDGRRYELAVTCKVRDAEGFRGESA